MLANKMMGDSGDKQISFEDHSSEPHVVVACPSCRTKFAVESSLVASYENPKFHCSRCDSVFDLHRKNHNRADHQTQQRWVLADNADAKIPNPFAQPQAHSQPPSSIKPGDFTLGTPANEAVLEPRKPFAPLEERAGLSLLGLRPSAGATVASATLTRQQAFSPAPETSANTTQHEDDPFALFDPPSISDSHQATKTPATIEAPRVAEPPRVAPPQTHTAKSVPIEPQRAPSPAQQTTPGTARKDEQPSSQPARPALAMRLKEPLRGMIASLSMRNQHLTRMSLPVISTILAICCVGYAARLMPQTFDSIFATVVPSMISGKISHLPEQSLHVQEVSLDFEKTQSKEIVPVIRGVINNTANATVEDVLIEALGFDYRGEIVVRAQAPLRSALAREKISDLSLDTVKKFQTSLSARNSTIGAGEKVAFTVALLGEAGAAQDVSYFSARIFSVGATR